MFTKDLEKAYGNIASISREASQGSVTAQVSDLWRDIFAERKNFPELDDLVAFRRNGETYGIGDPRYTNAADLHRHCRKNALLLKDDNITDEFLSLVREPTVGAPRLSAQHALGFHASPNFLKNLKNAYRIYRFMGPERSREAIDICEIGPGYGLLANMLHQIFNVRSYTIIDLKQNLYLSSYYLSCTIPERSVVMRPESYFSAGGDIAFFAAEDIGNVKSQFDLVINVDSFGEMPRDAARYYVDWAKERIKPRGLLHTDNRVRVRGNRGPQSFSDMGYLEGWEFLSLTGTETQAEVLSQGHHIAFMTPNTEQKYASDVWNMTSVLYTLGLGPSLDRHVENGWVDFDAEMVAQVRRVTENCEPVVVADAIRTLESRNSQQAVVQFLLYYLKFASGAPVSDYRRHLVDYRASGVREPASAIAGCVDILVEQDSARQAELVRQFVAAFPHLEEDVSAYLKNPGRSLRLLKSNAAENLLAKRLEGGFLRKAKRRVTGNYLL